VAYVKSLGAPAGQGTSAAANNPQTSTQQVQ